MWDWSRQGNCFTIQTLIEHGTSQENTSHSSVPDNLLKDRDGDKQIENGMRHVDVCQCVYDSPCSGPCVQSTVQPAVQTGDEEVHVSLISGDVVFKFYIGTK